MATKIPRELMTIAGPFTSDEYRSHWEKMASIPFGEIKFAAKVLEKVFSQFLIERGLYIKRDDRILSYIKYRRWVQKNRDAQWEYDWTLRRLSKKNEYDTDSDRERYLNDLVELKIKIQKGLEKSDLYRSQFRLWKKTGGVDEAKFIKATYDQYLSNLNVKT